MAIKTSSNTSFLRTAVQPKMIGLLVLFMAMAAVCGRLGVWQLDRAYERANLTKQHEIAEATNLDSVPLGEVLAPQTTFPGDLVSKEVKVTGTFEPGTELLLPGRLVNNEPAVLVLSALRVQEDGTGGKSWEDLSGPPILPVLRGAVPVSAIDAQGQIDPVWAAKIVPASGPVEITGWLQASEAKGVQDFGPGQTDSISSAHLANVWGGPIYGGYLVAKEMTPSDTADISGLPRPTIEGGDGVNMQNFFYALQWWVFGLFAFALWVRLVRDNARRTSTEHPVNPFDKVDAAGSNANPFDRVDKVKDQSVPD